MDRGATEYHPVSPGRTAVSGEGDGGRPATTTRRGPSHWPAVVLSVLGSAVAVAAVGCFCALVYPILKGKASVCVCVCVSLKVSKFGYTEVESADETNRVPTKLPPSVC